MSRGERIPQITISNNGYANRMRHIEIHIIESELDAASAVQCGLLTDPFLVTACLDCGDDVGALDRFEPYCLVLDDEAEWIICTYCAEPITDPDDSRYEDSDAYSQLLEQELSNDDDDDDRFRIIDDE
jgi:hypothetical protein